MIAQRAAVVPQHIHRRDHRVGRGLIRLKRQIIAQRIALQKIPVVQQERIARPRPKISYQTGRTRQAHGLGRLVGIVVVPAHMHMQVGCF